jgi:aminoglycoside 6'-N-acetyltransferase I
MTVEVRLLGPADASVLECVADGVFDHDVDPTLAAEFLADPRHCLCVAIVDGVVAGMASGVRYVHPDKPSELWINEVGVAPAFHRQGLGKRIMAELLAHARREGCREAWVLTDDDNSAARALYRAAGGDDGSAQRMITFRLDD